MRVPGRSAATAAAAVAALAAGCRREPAPAAPAPRPATALAPGPFVPGVDEFVREAHVSEEAAEQVRAGLGGALCKALVREDRGALAAVLDGEFSGRLVAGPRALTPDESAIAVEAFDPDPAALDAAAFAGRLLAHRARFSTIDFCKLKPFKFKLDARGRARARADLAFDLAGRDAQGRRLRDRAAAAAELVRRGEAWRLRRVEFGALESIRARAEPFLDVTAATGATVAAPKAEREAVQARIDTLSIQTIGGLGVIDHDRDGFDDLLVWRHGRELLLLRNDGRGGFQRRGPLLPPEQTGLFHLWADLDGDGAEELVSSAVAGCARGRARLGLYRRRGERYLPAGELSFAPPASGADACAGWRELRFEHVAVGDADGDGRPDLFVSGYSRRGSQANRFNSYVASDGLRNLLFLNRGGLRFAEEGAGRGLTDTSYTYVVEPYDFDGDGDLDLYAVNDYGPNELLLNDGAGRFSRAPDGPLTENGQSMGATVADLDGDLDFDVYVSNMYSSAGNRIVPLVEGRVSDETFRTLSRLAIGNTLYAREGGAWVERAGELGVQKAEWAWGHVVFDLDNDGDRDIFVANGEHSHSDPDAPDF